MKVLNLKNLKLEQCLANAQKESVVITQDGKPLVYMVGVGGMDLEQISLGQSDELWNLIEERRQQKPISRKELEKKLREKKKRS
jgi:hypothetical protein